MNVYEIIPPITADINIMRVNMIFDVPLMLMCKFMAAHRACGEWLIL